MKPASCRIRAATAAVVALCACGHPATGQERRFPYQQGFEEAPGLPLPAGWVSSRKRSPPADDFALSASSPKTGKGCLLAGNATIGQELLSPLFDCTGVVLSEIAFALKRSSTFTSPLILEASLDSGRTFPLAVGDTVKPDGSTGYVVVQLPMPVSCSGCPALRLRWRTIAVSTGSTGTLRLDDVVLRAYHPPGDEHVVINEFLYEPLGGRAEFVELYNAGHDSVWFSGWELSDRPGTSGRASLLSLSDLQDPLPPGGYAVVASDSTLLTMLPPRPMVLVVGSSWPSLNNDGDDVILRDVAGRAVDSIAFFPSWHTPSIADRRGRSLERISAYAPSNGPTSWATCVSPAGSTPGTVNSVSATPAQSSATVSCAPNPFSPDTDGRNDATIVGYCLPEGTWRVTVTVYDVRGRLVRRLGEDLPAVCEGSLVWDGRDDLRRRVRVGMYVLLLEGWESGGARSVSAKCVGVVGRR